MKTYIGIDNGVTGTIAVLGENLVYMMPMPVKTEQSYTKARQTITRIDYSKFQKHLYDLYSLLIDRMNAIGNPDMLALLERPMVMPGRFKATLSAIRALESVLICLEYMDVPYRYIDSKEWQRQMLPQGTDKKDLKKVSLEIGKRLFPSVDFKRFHDADSLLMAEWARRLNL